MIRLCMHGKYHFFLVHSLFFRISTLIRDSVLTGFICFFIVLFFFSKFMIFNVKPTVSFSFLLIKLITIKNVSLKFRLNKTEPCPMRLTNDTIINVKPTQINKYEIPMEKFVAAHTNRARNTKKKKIVIKIMTLIYVPISDLQFFFQVLR